MEWDFFISHASEDKDTIARPLARHLIGAGYRIWFDEFELRVGDSLRARIDEGLSRSQFGIVILSRSFFLKKWPKAELDGLFARDSYDTPRLLPVWHGLRAEEVAAESPLLSARVAAVGDNVHDIGASILRAAVHSGLPVPNERLASILDAGDSLQTVDYFLLNPPIVAQAMHCSGRLLVRPKLSGWSGGSVDFLFTRFQPSADATDVRALMLGPVLAKEDTSAAAVVANAIEFARFCETSGLGRGRANRWRRASVPDSHLLPRRRGAWGIVEITVVAGRRADSELLHSTCLSSSPDGVELRSYDWLKDIANDAGTERRFYETVRVVGPNHPCSLAALISESTERD